MKSKGRKRRKDLKIKENEGFKIFATQSALGLGGP